MANPKVRTASMLAGSSVNSRKYSVPGTAVKGDTLLIWAYIETTGITFSVAGGGWTKIAQTKQTSEGWEAVAFILPSWNGTTTEYTLEWGGTKKFNAGAIVVVESADPTTPLGAQSGANFRENTPASKSAAVDGLTATRDGSLLITGVFNDNGSLGGEASGWTEVGDQADSPQICSRNELATKGAQPGVTHSLGTSSISLTLMIAIQPAPKAKGRRRFTSIG